MCTNVCWKKPDVNVSGSTSTSVGLDPAGALYTVLVDEVELPEESELRGTFGIATSFRRDERIVSGDLGTGVL